jgi:hypothetical protein
VEEQHLHRELIGNELTKDQQEERVCQDRTGILQNFVGEALQKFISRNPFAPENIVIYRDGVGGPTMQRQVLNYELEKVSAAIAGFQPNYSPKILYTIVDKKINTRFAEKYQDTYKNPAPGTVVDSGLVEEAGDLTYDFYMVPHKATVATALPVHYHVVKNTTALRKQEVQ